MNEPSISSGYDVSSNSLYDLLQSPTLVKVGFGLYISTEAIRAVVPVSDNDQDELYDIVSIPFFKQDKVKCLVLYEDGRILPSYYNVDRTIRILNGVDGVKRVA